MIDGLDRRTRGWAIAATLLGVLAIGLLEYLEEPESSALDLLFELLKAVPLALASVGVVLLFQVMRRQRAEHLLVMHDLELARVQGRHWRSQSRALLNGLGEAIDVQFTQWGLSPAEREVALLLLKGLSSKEIATMRCASERTVREQARAVYAKAGLTGRAHLAAFFLEDLLMPIEAAA